MAYIPKNSPGVDDLEGLLSWLQQELDEIQKAFVSQEFLRLKKWYEQPPKIFDGMVVYADGSEWDPGSGAGVYYYNGSAWVKLG